MKKGMRIYEKNSFLDKLQAYNNRLREQNTDRAKRDIKQSKQQILYSNVKYIMTEPKRRRKIKQVNQMMIRKRFKKKMFLFFSTFCLFSQLIEIKQPGTFYNLPRKNVKVSVYSFFFFSSFVSFSLVYFCVSSNC